LATRPRALPARGARKFDGTGYSGIVWASLRTKSYALLPLKLTAARDTTIDRHEDAHSIRATASQELEVRTPH
jgi:hypothetical protein